ncbi:cytochrome P450 monooxygenase [Fusarium heterosporum]|uniref:Cytochrome P450 monooxygenase n=1 Tax=Fusarium heterosporum TaxID=42747 RepID=A0A8H5TCS0_FUSHE|nr:cytochrome P450 monooxygenase [Fusarium heterosporum]
MSHQSALIWALLHIPTAIFATIVLVTVYSVFQAVYNVTFHPLSRFPGPWTRGATKIPYLAAMWTGFHHRAMHQLHEKYGPVVRIAPNNLSFINPEAWKDIYAHKKTRDQEMVKDPEFYVRNPDAPHIVNGNHEEHARYRRLYSPGFSARSLREQEPLIQGYVNMFIGGLTRLCEHGETPIDMVQWFNFVTFDIIGDLAFGEPFGCLENGATDWLAKLNQIEEAQMRFRVIQHIPFVGRFARQIVNTMLPTDAVIGAEGHRKLTYQKVARRVENNAHRPDFMDHILRQPPGKGFTFQEMLSNSATLIQAGSETTATLLSGALFLLLHNPDKMEKLVDELTTAFKSDEDMTIENTERLPYLAAVLEEGLRLYSPAVPGFPRCVPKSGATIDGEYVPGGTSVAVNHYAAYHSPLNFSRPLEFIPERWINLDAFPEDKREVLQPFSVGPRNCIGRSSEIIKANLEKASPMQKDVLSWVELYGSLTCGEVKSPTIG